MLLNFCSGLLIILTFALLTHPFSGMMNLTFSLFPNHIDVHVLIQREPTLMLALVVLTYVLSNIILHPPFLLIVLGKNGTLLITIRNRSRF